MDERDIFCERDSGFPNPSQVETNWWMYSCGLSFRQLEKIDELSVTQGLATTVNLNSSGRLPEIKISSQNRELPRAEIAEFDPTNIEISILPPRDPYAERQEQILSVLTHPRIRRGKLELIQTYFPKFSDTVRARIRRGDPIDIVLPSLPFKDQNPLTTQHSLSFTDLGEYLLFAQLRDISMSVEAVYPPGAHIIILCDGIAYADIFAGGQTEEIIQYRTNCWNIKEQLGLRHKVDIVDMNWVIRQEPRFSLVKKQIHDLLVHLEKYDGEVQKRMRILRHGMLINTAHPGFDVTDVSRFTILPEEQLPDDVREKITQAALAYASFLLTMRHLEIIQRAFPGALRATVHPKDAPQLPLHLVNENSAVFPYNGVPLVSKNKILRGKNLRRSTRIVRFFEVLRHQQAIAVFLDGQREPFYYVV